MSDTELDRDWKPTTARPQSTMARQFSLALNDLFQIDNSVADLDAAVFEKKKAVDSQTSELEQLEARLRLTEERLRARQAGSESSTQPLSERLPNATQKTPSRPTTRGEGAENTPQQAPLDNVPGKDLRMPGGMPPTPGASEDGKSCPYPN